MKATTKNETNRVYSLEIRGVLFDGMSLSLDMAIMGPLSEAYCRDHGGRIWFYERISSEISWQACPTNSIRIDTVKGTTWFGRLVRDCLRGTSLQLPDDRLPIAMTKEIKDAMTGRVIRATLSNDPRSGHVRIKKRSIELVPLAPPISQLERDMTPVQLELI